MAPGFSISMDDISISLDGKVIIDSPALREYVETQKKNLKEADLMDFLCPNV